MDLTGFQELIDSITKYKSGDYVSFFKIDLFDDEPRGVITGTNPVMSATIEKVHIVSKSNGFHISYEFCELHGIVDEDKILGKCKIIITLPDGTETSMDELKRKK
jgi:hypothetical protein